MTLASPTRPTGVLTTEWVRPSVDIVLEAAQPADKKVAGRLARLTFQYECADTLGINRRIYPSELMAPAAEDLNSQCTDGQIFGRLDHPKMGYYSGDGEDAMRVTMRDAAFRVVSFEMAGRKAVKVVCDVCDNENGRQLMSLYSVGGNPGISFRSMAWWDQLSPEEKTKYAVPQDENADIARSLRLVTLDIVSKPGFPDAKSAARTEEQDHPMDIATLRAQHPTLVASIESAAREAGKKEAEGLLAKQVTAALEDARPKIITDAVAPLNTELATLRAESAKHKTGLGAIVTALAAAGVAVGESADAGLKAQVATAEAAAAAAKTELEKLKTEAAKAQKDLADERNVRLSAECAAAVGEQFKAHPFREDIVAAVKGCTDKTEALSKATAEAARIDRIRGVKPGKGKTVQTEADPEASAEGALEGERKTPTAEAATGRAMLGYLGEEEEN